MLMLIRKLKGRLSQWVPSPHQVDCSRFTDIFPAPTDMAVRAMMEHFRAVNGWKPFFHEQLRYINPGISGELNQAYQGLNIAFVQDGNFILKDNIKTDLLFDLRSQLIYPTWFFIQKCTGIKPEDTLSDERIQKEYRQ